MGSTISAPVIYTERIQRPRLASFLYLASSFSFSFSSPSLPSTPFAVLLLKCVCVYARILNVSTREATNH